MPSIKNLEKASIKEMREMEQRIKKEIEKLEIERSTYQETIHEAKINQ